ncbi:MAG: D-glycerate dehydrogenase, partial [Spirochaetota bacterium]|nr:D-glycerate dehydrogenase [Spirochaetota bacterium]
ELAFALMIAVTRRLLEGDRFVRSGKWVTGWEINLFQGFDLHHKTLGIIGMGNIGQSLAKKAHAFDMKIIYHNRNRLDNSIENLYDAKYTSLEVLLSESDIISLHTPLSPETHHLIDEKEIELMKDTAIIINTARGEVINEKSLYEALRVKRIWGAGLDVFENEPILTPGLVDLENVILLPHIGSASVETRNRMSMMVVNNVIAGISGNIPNNLVNKGVLGDWK